MPNTGAPCVQHREFECTSDEIFFPLFPGQSGDPASSSRFTAITVEKKAVIKYRPSYLLSLDGDTDLLPLSLREEARESFGSTSLHLQLVYIVPLRSLYSLYSRPKSTIPYSPFEMRGTLLSSCHAHSRCHNVAGGPSFPDAVAWRTRMRQDPGG